MAYPDKINLTPDANLRYAKMNFTKLVHTNARFEGINTTLPQTQAIVDGMAVSGVRTDAIVTIVDLKRGWDYVLHLREPLSMPAEKEINRLVAAQDSLAPGELRSGTGGVNLGSQDFVPPAVDPAKEQAYFAALMTADRTTTDKAMTLMYHNMRGQIFWEGNKRTATIAANKLMIDGGAGLINVPLDRWAEWNELLAAFYRSGDMGPIKDWTYQVAVQVPTMGKTLEAQLTRPLGQSLQPQNEIR